ncbi:TIR domain-containing protein [Parafilimonas sp.]|uniref:TIR domain-containing protein n=1 Tax=Parafilimonas sp. TaxID=1969739 RepID=UPI003F816071
MKDSSKIFINYRREDTSGYAGRIADALASEFGENNIFIDVTKINTGSDFTEVITQALDQSRYLLILIGNTWLNCKDSAGNRRLDNTDDFVRKEISLAIKRKVKLIPVLLEDARMPDAGALPDDIKDLCKWQAIEITDSRWKFDIERLIKSINLRKKLFVFNRKLVLPLLLILAAAMAFGIWKKSSNENIAHSSTPKDYYRNAKMFELSGDFANAQKSYKQYLKFNLSYIDPHLSYQSMLKSQEGINAARQEYKALLSTHATVVTMFANALLADREVAITSLLQLVKQYPDFAPAFYELSNEYSQDKLGERSLTEKSLEQTYLAEFLHLDSLGYNQKYYIDKAIAIQQTKDAVSRLKQAGYATAALKSQVEMIYMLANDGWHLYTNIGEPAVKIYYKFNNDTGYRATGLTGYQRSGREIPDPNMFVGRLKNGQYPVSVKYIDTKGQEQGPFSFMLDTQKERIISVKKNLAQMNWVSFQKYDNRLLVYFTSLLSNRDVIKAINYSLNNESLSQTFPVQPWTKGGIPEMQEDIYVDAPSSTKFIAVKLTFIDGSVTELKRFDNDAAAE